MLSLRGATRRSLTDKGEILGGGRRGSAPAPARDPSKSLDIPTRFNCQSITRPDPKPVGVIPGTGIVGKADIEEKTVLGIAKHEGSRNATCVWVWGLYVTRGNEGLLRLAPSCNTVCTASWTVQELLDRVHDGVPPRGAPVEH